MLIYKLEIFNGNLHLNLQDRHARFVFHCDASYLRELQRKIEFRDTYLFFYNTIYKLCKKNTLILNFACS